MKKQSTLSTCLFAAIARGFNIDRLFPTRKNADPVEANIKALLIWDES